MRLLSAQRGCTIKLSESTIGSYLKSNIVLLRSMIAEGYGDPRTLERRVRNMEKWLENPELLEADADAEYAAIIEIDLAEVTEPVVCAPNDPDDARLLSQVAGDQVDEVFIGSRMTNIGHFRATGNCLTSTQAVSQHVCGSVRLPVWTSISSWRKAITPSSDAQVRELKCQDVRCAWATRHA